jgi:hypothetical protein
MKGKRSNHQDLSLPLYLCGRARQTLLATRQWHKIIFLDLECGRICTAGFGCGWQGSQPHWGGRFKLTIAYGAAVINTIAGGGQHS